MISSTREPLGKVPEVSVVIPAYNAERTLVQALESVSVKQEAAWEALVIDDGSTDGTAAIAASWARKDPRIRVLTHEDHHNHGVAASRNLGIQASRGTIVAFLDADDIFLPGALARFTAAFRRFPGAGVVYGLAEMFEPQQNATTIVGRGVANVPVRLFEQLCRFNVLITSATAARRDVLGDAPFPTGLPFQFEDWTCWVGLARRTPFLFVPELLTTYRKASHGAMGRIERSGSVPRFEAAQARFLQALLPAATPAERNAIRRGLAFRTTGTLLTALSQGRRLRIRDAIEWFVTGMSISGSTGVFLSALPHLAREHRRAIQGTNPPLVAPPWNGSALH